MSAFLNRRLLLACALPAVASASLPSAGAGTRKTLIMVNTVYPPFVNAPGDPAGEGLDVEIAREALRRAGFEMSLTLRPWKRALLELETGQADFTTTISRRDDRSRYLAWSPPYRNGADYCFFARPGAPFTLTQLDELRGRRLGVVSGFHYPPLLLGVPGLNLVPGRDVTMLVRMLLAQRSDYMVATALAGRWELRQLGLSEQVREQPFRYHSDSPNYLAFARASAAAMAALPAVSEALTQLGADGTLKQIEQRYGA